MGLKSRFVGGRLEKDLRYGFLKHWSNDLKLMHSSNPENACVKGVSQDITNSWFE